MADKVRYHINDEGNPGICRAKNRCRFGYPDAEHFDTPEEARAAYADVMDARRMAEEKARVEAKRSPMGVLPLTHREMNKSSDAFYRVVNDQDDEALRHLAEYYYSKEVYKITDDIDEKKAMLVAKAKLLKTRVGAGYTGWKYDKLDELNEMSEDEIQSFDTSIPPPSYASQLSQELPLEGEERSALSGVARLNAVSTYANDSKKFLTNLSAREHNAIAYWTGCGSTVAKSTIYGFSNPWGIQSDDPDDDDYFDPSEYMHTVDAAIDKAPVTEPRILYKGVSEDSAGAEVAEEYYGESGDRPLTLEWAASKYPVGAEVTFDMPESTSMNSATATDFAGAGVVLEIRARKAAPVGALSAWGLSEMEYLVPRTTKYRVVGVQEDQQFGKAGMGGASFDQSMFVVQLEQVLEGEE